MKKSSFNGLLSKTINKIAFEELEKLKLSHSKVENVKHKMLQMRKYFMPSEYNATKEEIKIIFKLRCRVTELRTNLKGKQAGAELCQAQVELGPAKIEIFFHLIEIGGLLTLTSRKLHKRIE